MARTIAWKDGSKWLADEPMFQHVTRALESVKDNVWGLAPILSRWHSLASRSEVLDVDEIAPSEEDRAVLTAALERALEEARASTATEMGFDDPADYAAYVDSLARLHELFMTDVTYDPQDLVRPRR